MKKQLITVLALGASALLFWASNSTSRISKTYETRQEIERPTTSGATHPVRYEVPVIEPEAGTPQRQSKGGVEVWCEVAPPQISKTTRTERRPVYVSKSEYDSHLDVFRVASYPEYQLDFVQAQFKITVFNKQDRVLKLIDVPVVMLIDGDQFQISDENYVTWRNAMIVKGFNKEIFLPGPDLERVRTAKSIYVSVNDVPISYDKAGNVIEKQNFEWRFSARVEQRTENVPITYTYETRPVHQEDCSSCEGGTKEAKCDLCDGNGKYTNKEGKLVSCFRCGGDGKVSQKCYSCSGRGFNYHPQSSVTPVLDRETWNGWKVRVWSKSGQHPIWVVDPATGSYRSVGKTGEIGGQSAESIDYWHSGAGKTYSLMVMRDGRNLYMVNPVKQGNKPSPKVTIDFSVDPPEISGGEFVWVPERLVPPAKTNPDLNMVPRSEFAKAIQGTWVRTSEKGGTTVEEISANGITVWANGREFVRGTYQIKADTFFFDYKVNSKNFPSYTGPTSGYSVIVSFSRDRLAFVYEGAKQVFFRAEE